MNCAPSWEERINAGFGENQRFVEEHGRAPQHGEDNDIFERLYAVRLDRIRTLEECRALVLPLDHQSLLSGVYTNDAESIETMDDDALLAEGRCCRGTRDYRVTTYVLWAAWNYLVLFMMAQW